MLILAPFYRRAQQIWLCPFHFLWATGSWTLSSLFRYYIGFLCGALFQRACQNQLHTSDVLKAYQAQNLLEEKQGQGHFYAT